MVVSDSILNRLDDPKIHSGDIFSFSNDVIPSDTNEPHYAIPAHQVVQQAPIYQPYINTVNNQLLNSYRPSEYQNPKVILIIYVLYNYNLQENIIAYSQVVYEPQFQPQFQPQLGHFSDPKIPQTYYVANQATPQIIQPPEHYMQVLPQIQHIPYTSPATISDTTKLASTSVQNDIAVSSNFVYTPSEEVSKILKEFKSSNLYLSNKDTQPAPPIASITTPQINSEALKNSGLSKPKQENIHSNLVSASIYNPYAYNQNDYNIKYNMNPNSASIYQDKIPLSSLYSHDSFNVPDLKSSNKYEEKPKSSSTPSISNHLIYLFIIIILC